MQKNVERSITRQNNNSQLNAFLNTYKNTENITIFSLTDCNDNKMLTAQQPRHADIMHN